MYDNEFNTTGYPLAHLFTFRCYGTWLPGDSRGTITKDHNIYGTRYLPPDWKRRELSEDLMSHDPVRLDGPMRAAVETAIRETCEIRKWEIFALNVRTNHVHCVASIGDRSPDKALSALKANATRVLREAGLLKNSQPAWAAKGSKRYLWNDEAVFHAIEYVVSGQGGELPKF
ncbi:MAG: transposase [Acidobacteriota bacterium]|nr:MAG: transposase [Acidobacteriota bacterium]